MKALVFNGPKDIRYETYPDPKLGSDNSVILKVEQCSICGSDLHMYHGENIGSANYGDGFEKFCVGHEFTGEIVEVGRNVHRFRVGQRVLSTGGTGLTARDVTPEAFRGLFEKEIDGFGELFRMLSYQKIGTSTIQSRALGGIARGTLLFAFR